MCWADHWEWDDVRPILQDVVINQIKHKVFSCWWQLRQESRLEEFIREPAEHYFVFRIPGHGLMTDSFNKLFTPSPYPAQNWSPTCFEQKHVNCQDSQWAFCGLWTLCGVSREKKQMSSTMLKWTFNKNLPFITLSKGGRRTSLRVEAKTLWSRNVETDVRPLSDYLLSAIWIFLVFPIFFVVMQNLFAALRNVSSGNSLPTSSFAFWQMENVLLAISHVHLTEERAWSNLTQSGC